MRRLWRDIAHHTPAGPSLWTRIDANFSPRINTLSPSRSQSLPLDVDFDLNWMNKAKGESTPRGPVHPEHARFSLTEVCQHFYRWRTARLVVRAYETAIIQVLGSPAASITKIELELFPPYGGLAERNLDLFVGKAKNLESVKLRRVPVLWTTQVLKNLRTLELEDI